MNGDSDRLDRALNAIAFTFPLADDRDRAADILEIALRSLVCRHRPAVDALGAPLTPRLASPAAVDWESLRQAAKAIMRDVGLEEMAKQFGTSPASLLDIVNRTREPGIGRKARFLQIVQGAANEESVPVRGEMTPQGIRR